MKPDLTDALLYGILDLGYVADSDISRVAKAMVAGGVDVIQLRAKQKSVREIARLAGQLLEITSPSAIPLVINDHASIAATIAVDGVHVGQDDDSVATAREKAGRELIVGKSTHSREQAIAAEAEGADYIGFGPVFPTPTKPDYEPIGSNHIEEVHQRVNVPIFCIGGIKLENLEQVIAAGAQRVAIVSGLLKATDIAKYGREAKRMLDSTFVIRPSSF